jgi:hypothetical protein
VICGLEQMVNYDVMKNSKCYADRKGYERKHSREIWTTMWIREDNKGGCHDQIWSDMWIVTDDEWCCHDQY